QLSEPHDLQPFPTRRSSDLDGWKRYVIVVQCRGPPTPMLRARNDPRSGAASFTTSVSGSFQKSARRTWNSRSSVLARTVAGPASDRKSTRLNSSHGSISYAV